VKSRRLAVALVATALVGVAGCGEDESDSGAADVGTDAQTTAQPPPVDTTKKPIVEVPKGQAPAGLQIEDLKEGDGPTAKSGDPVTVQYVGVAYSTGEEFDSSWDSGQPFSFTLGTGGVIQGWDQGVAGMKVGGRRRLTIPPDLAYGEQGSPPAIGPNETLIFVVDLLSTG
jgi:peptidylprolyl isomerase